MDYVGRFEPTSRALLSDLTKPEYRLLVYNLRYGAINVGVAIDQLLDYRLEVQNQQFLFSSDWGIYSIYSYISVPI